MKKFKIIKNSTLRVQHFFSDYFLSNLLFQSIRVMLIIPMISFLFSAILLNSNVTSLTDNNIISILKHPANLVLGTLLILVAILFIFYQLGYYFALADEQINNREYNFKSIIGKLNKKAKYFLSFSAIFFALYFLILSPIIMIGLDTQLTSSLKIPNFIVDELLLSTQGKIIYFGALIFMTYIGIRLIYTIYFFISNENLSIKDSIKESFKFSRKKTISNLILILLASFVFTFILAILIGIGLLPVALSDAFYPKISFITAGISLTLINGIVFFVGGLFEPIIINVIVETTGDYNQPIEYTRKPVNILTAIKSNKALSTMSIVFTLFFFGLNVFSVMDLVYSPQTLIIAHRGFTENAVENSIESLRDAKAAGAEYVEFDIQQTADGKFVVIHDFNLKRLAGINKSVKNMTLDELTKITIKQNGHTAKIPSFEEFLDVAKEIDMQLLIEIKPHGKETADMEELFVKLLKEKKADRANIVHSLDLSTLEKIKKIDPNIKTGYIIPLLIGKIPENSCDFVVLEDFSVKSSTLSNVRDAKKQLFVWTINEEDLMKKYFRMGVSAIITNHPDTALQIRNDETANKSFFDRVNLLIEE